MFLMQHYGIPTRLLDWSESPLIALYFALSEEQENNKDAIVWSLKPTELNKNHISFNKDEDILPHFEDTEVKDYLLKTMSLSDVVLNPIAIIADRNNIRMQSQLAAFTIHHLKKEPIEDIGVRKHVSKYIISSKCKKEILKLLSVIGIDKFRLFPELSNIKEILIQRGLV